MWVVAFSLVFFLHFNLKVDVLRHSHGLLPGPAAKVASDHNLHRCLRPHCHFFKPSPLPSKVCPCGGWAWSPADHLRLRDLLVRELHHHCRLSQVRREIVGIFFRHPALSFFFSNNALEPSSLVICNGIVELVQVDNQTKTFFSSGFSQKKISWSQVNLQLLFIADLKHKCVAEEHKRTKPGRQVQQDQQICLSWDCLALSSFAINGCHNDLQVVTFLILCNLGLWITYNFEIQKVAATPDQVHLI